jgi:CO/xanthine dehydrogenase FAD-binding subunit
VDGDPEAAIADADVFGDAFAPADYRRQLARACVRRAVERAELRAKEGAR